MFNLYNLHTTRMRLWTSFIYSYPLHVTSILSAPIALKSSIAFLNPKLATTYCLPNFLWYNAQNWAIVHEFPGSSKSSERTSYAKYRRAVFWLRVTTLSWTYKQRYNQLEPRSILILRSLYSMKLITPVRLRSTLIDFRVMIYSALCYPRESCFRVLVNLRKLLLKEKWYATDNKLK